MSLVGLELGYLFETGNRIPDRRADRCSPFPQWNLDLGLHEKQRVLEQSFGFARDPVRATMDHKHQAERDLELDSELLGM